MNQYMYDGPVMEFDTCVANKMAGFYIRGIRKESQE